MGIQTAKPSISTQLLSLPLVWLAAAFLGGIILGRFIELSILSWIQLVFLGLVIAFILRYIRPLTPFAILLIPAVLFLGAARYQSAQPVNNSSFIAYYNGLDRKIYITGTLIEEPDIRDTYENLRIRVSALDTGGGDFPVRGDILVRLGNDYEVAYGDHVRVRGFVETPPAEEIFSYRDYLARQGIYSITQTNSITMLPGKDANPFWAWMYRTHNSLVKRLNLIFPAPESSLLSGILLGADKNIPVEIQQAFKNTGTSHIIAISGFNIAIVASVLVLLFNKLLGRKWGSYLAILGIAFYTLLVGASPSVVRAAIMGGISIIAWLIGRRSLAMTALSTSALVMAAFNPFVLWDVSFQLSFAATLGLVIYAQPMQDYVRAFLSRFVPPAYLDKFIGPFSNYVLLTFAAQLTTLPISIYYFGRISLVSFLANPFILPAQPAIMIFGGLAAVFSKIYLPLGQLFAWITWPFAAYTIRMVEFFNGFPGGVWVLGEVALIIVILFYCILFASTLAWSRFKNILTPTYLISFLAILTFLTWRSVYCLPDGLLHVYFLDVGSADGILITTPGGRNVLINGGESPSSLADQLGRRIAPFNRGLDYLLVASTQENQLAALPRVVDQYRPANILWSGNFEASYSSRKLKEWVTVNYVPLEIAKSDSGLDLGDGTILRVLAASNRGAILSVEKGNFKAVLPVGVNFDVFDQLEYGKNIGSVSALLISESGYAPSNPPEWLANLKPQVTILSVAAADPNGLPSNDVINEVQSSNLLRTDQLGWIDLSTDGNQLWITTEHQKVSQ